MSSSIVAVSCFLAGRVVERLDGTVAVSFLFPGRVQEAGAEEAVWALIPNALLGISLAAVAVALVSLAGWAGNRRRRLVELEPICRNWRKRFHGNLGRASSLMDRAFLLKENASFLSGLTLRLTREATREVDKAYLIAAAADWVLHRVDQLICPECRSLRWAFGADLAEAERLLTGKSVGFANINERNAILYFDTERKDYRQLIGGEDEHHPFALSLEEAERGLEERLWEAEKRIRRLEEGMSQLPVDLERGSRDLGALAQRLGRLAEESRRDGFFPLAALAERLIPSAEALLENAARRAVIDPVAAYENPCRMALRQIRDALSMVETVERVRQQDFPAVEKVAELLDHHSIDSGWIDREYWEHSVILESIASHCVLWPAGSNLERFRLNLDRSRKRVTAAAELVHETQRNILPRIGVTEEAIETCRAEFAAILQIDPSRIMREGEFDPSLRVEKSRSVVRCIGDLIGIGLPEPARESLRLVEEQIREANESLKVGRHVIERGDVYYEEAEERLALAKSRFAEYEARLRTLERFDPLVFEPRERWGIPVPGGEALERDPAATWSRMLAVERMLAGVLDACEHGRLLTAGSLLQAAAAEAVNIDDQISAVEAWGEVLDQTAALLPVQLAQCRFRLRTLSARIDDPRSRLPSLEECRRLEEGISRCEDFLNRPQGAAHPLKVRQSLEELEHQIAALDQRVSLDWELHELAVQSIKWAARSLRRQRELLDGLGEEGKLRARERLEELRHSLERWQNFLEERHQDWGEAFLGSVDLEIRTAALAADLLGKRHGALGAAPHGIRAAAEAALELAKLAGPAVDRQAGLSLLSQARAAMAEGDCQRAQTLSAASLAHTRAALLQARAREAQTALEARNRKGKPAEAGSDCRNSGILDQPFPLTTPGSERIHPVTACLRRGFRNRRAVFRSRAQTVQPVLDGPEELALLPFDPHRPEAPAV